MSYEYSLVGTFSGDNPAAAAVAKAALVLGRDTRGVSEWDPRFDDDGLLIYTDESDEDERGLTLRHFRFENNMTLVFSDHSEPDGAIRTMQNIMRVTAAFAEDRSFYGVLLADYTDDAYLARIAEAKLTLNRLFWQKWEAASDVLTVVPQPYVFDDLRLTL